MAREDADVSAVTHAADRWRWIFAMLAVPTFFLSLYLALVALSEPLLTVRRPVVSADVIVVLGGDGPSRARWAAHLWQMGLAPEVLVTGDGDCLHIRDAMVADGVPAPAIRTECLSRNTRENALLSAPLLQHDVRSAVLVTSWFHARRALASFTSVCPGIEWSSDPAGPPGRLMATAFSHYGPAILQEYVKLVVYRVAAMRRPTRPVAAGDVCISGGKP
jgi:uncharacterized SAM-binding protein YcdF (DUF218 family)